MSDCEWEVGAQCNRLMAVTLECAKIDKGKGVVYLKLAGVEVGKLYTLDVDTGMLMSVGPEGLMTIEPF